MFVKNVSCFTIFSEFIANFACLYIGSAEPVTAAQRHDRPDVQVHVEHQPVDVAADYQRVAAVPAQVADQAAEDDLPLQVRGVRDPGGPVYGAQRCRGQCSK